MLDILGFVIRLTASLSHPALILVGINLAQGLDVANQLVIGSRQRLVSLFLDLPASWKCFNGRFQVFRYL